MKISLNDVVILSPRDTGHILGVSVSRVKQLCREGRLRDLRDSSGRRFFMPADVETFRLEREQAQSPVNGKKLRPMVRKFLERA